MKIALREGMAQGATLPEKLAFLERLGIEGVEVERSAGLPVEELRTIFAGSSVGAANLPGSTALLDPDPKARAEGLELTRRRLQLAGELEGCAGVLVVPQFGTRPQLPDLSPYKTAVELERELFALQLRELAGAVSGPPLFLEPLNRYEAHLVNRLEDGTTFANEFGPEIGIMADFFHMNIEEADIAASIRAAGSRIVYVHVADSNRLQPGRGHMDFRTGFAALKEIGYDGYLGIECRIEGPLEEALTETVEHLRREWAAA
ncbi:MAG: sugar phosphate isomerase/epimerase [Chloroflexota bacterium]|nr:sugar phosphate isomerase/epimerase [Chloroflexota bacterium]